MADPAACADQRHDGGLRESPGYDPPHQPRHTTPFDRPTAAAPAPNKGP